MSVIIFLETATLECPMCELTFKKLADMREHVHTHAVNGIFTCPHCPKVSAFLKVSSIPFGLWTEFFLCRLTTDTNSCENTSGLVTERYSSAVNCVRKRAKVSTNWEVTC